MRAPCIVLLVFSREISTLAQPISAWLSALGWSKNRGYLHLQAYMRKEPEDGLCREPYWSDGLGGQIGW
jgi:hypothetical protein